MLTQRQIRFSILYLLLFAVVAGIYWPATSSFFASDDWTLLGHYGIRSPLALSTFFSPHTIWFYRPLQAWQFSILYHLFALNAQAYDLVLLMMHFAVCAIAALLIFTITRSAGNTFATVALFGFSWIYADILLWKANYNTLQWAACSILACICYLRFTGNPTSRSRRWYVSALILALLDLFTKESAVMLPLLLFVVVSWREFEISPDWKRVGKFWLRAWPSLLPFACYSGMYVLFHQFCVVNIDPEVDPGYYFARPTAAFAQWMHAINHSLFSFAFDPVFLAQVPSLQQGLQWSVQNLWPLPLLIAWLLWHFRAATALGALSLLAASLLPTAFLLNYHASRYYYLPALGAAAFWAGLIIPAVRRAAVSRDSLARRWVAILAIAFTVYFCSANALTWNKVLLQDKQSSDLVRSGFNIARSARSKLPGGSLLVLKDIPDSYMNTGRGAKQFARFALLDPTAEGTIIGADMAPAEIRRLNAIQNRYLLDFSAEPPALSRIESRGAFTPIN
jgi:hypothetical protein